MDEMNRDMIRMMADGEDVDDAAREAASRACGGAADAQQLEATQRAIRAAVGRAMKGDGVPAGLEARVKAVLAGDLREELPVHQTADAAERGGEGAGDGGPVIGQVGKGERRISIFAAAASLALVAGAILFGVFGPRIDSIVVRRFTDNVADAAIYANTEHAKCRGSGPACDAKAMMWTDAAEAQRELSSWLERPDLQVFDLSSMGYVFLGARKCELPAAMRSVQMVYCREEDGKRRAMLSVFAAPDVGQFDGDLMGGMEPGTLYPFGPVGSKCRLTVERCTNSRLVFFMVCCDESDLRALSGRIAECVVKE